MHIFTRLKLTSLVVIVTLCCSPVFAGVNNIEELDGSPSVYPWKLKVSNGTLTDNGDGTASLTTGGGTPGGSNTQVQFNDSSAFGGNSNFTFNKSTGLVTATRLNLTGDSVGTTGVLRILSGDAINQYIYLKESASNPGSVYFTIAGITGNAMAMGGIMSNGDPSYYVFTDAGGNEEFSIDMNGNISADGSLVLGIPLDVANGGTGLTSGTSGGIPYYNSTTTMASSSLFAANAVVIGGGAATAPLTITADTSTSHALFSTATSPAFRQINVSDIVGTITSTPAGSNTQVQFNDGGTTGADPTFQYYKGSNTLVISGDVGQSGSTYALVISADSGVRVSNISHDGSAFFNKVQLSNDLAVADGGTGLSSGTSGGILGYTATGTLASSTLLTQNGVMVGGGAGATPTAITADTTVTHALFATATSPAFRNINSGDIVGTYPTLAAGSNTQVQFNDRGFPGADPTYQYYKTSNTLVISADVAQSGTTNALIISSDQGRVVANISHDGSIFANKIQLSNDLAVVDGGTGLSAGVSGGIPYYSSTTAMTSSSLFAANAVVIGGGAGTAPATITADTSTSHALFSTAGSPAFRNINASDIQGTITATPAGSNTQIQFNDAGTSGADATFQYNKVSNTLTVSADVAQSGSTLALSISSDRGVTVANISHDGSSFFNKVQLSNDLAVADGGTGISSGTSGGVLAYTGTGTLASSALLTANAVVIGGGAGVAPSTITADTTTTHSLFATATGPAFRNINMTDLNGTATVAQGGTGNTTGTALRMAYYSSATTLAPAGGLISTDGTRVAIGPGTSTAISLDVAGAIRSVPLALTDGSSIAIDLSRSNLFTVTLAGQPRTLSNFTNGAPGQKFIVYVSQDASGSRKMGFGTKYMFGSTITSYDATTTAGMHDWIGFIVNQNGVSADVVAVAQGFR